MRVQKTKFNGKKAVIDSIISNVGSKMFSVNGKMARKSKIKTGVQSLVTYRETMKNQDVVKNIDNIERIKANGVEYTFFG